MVRLPRFGSPEHMIVVYLTIPFMLLAIAVATVPLLWTTRRQHQQRADAEVPSSERDAFPRERLLTRPPGSPS